MQDKAIMIRRNNWVVVFFAAVVTAIQLLNLIVGIPFLLVATVLGILLCVLGPLAYLSNRPQWKEKMASFTKYFNLIIIGLSMFFILAMDPHLINIMTLYFYVAVMGIYQDKIINICTLVITLFIVSYYFFTQGEVIFHSTDTMDLIYLLLTFCMVSATSALHSLFNNKLHKEMVIQKAEAIESQEKLQEILNGINRSLTTVKGYQQELNQATDETNLRSTEIVALLDEMLGSFDMQMEKSNQVHQGMSSTNSRVEDITHSISDMHKNVESTNAATNESVQRIDLLETDLQSFNSDIQHTVLLMKELTEETETIEKISQSIGNISKQTNLLALNASIESARAGEQGKGFAVVAEEVRKLAESSKLSTELIAGLLISIRSKINKVSETISRSQQSIVNNTQSMVEVKGIFTTVDTNMKNIADQTKDLQTFILNVQSLMQEVSAGVEITRHSTETNKGSLEDSLTLVSNQQNDIQELSNGFSKLEESIAHLLVKH